MSRRWLALALLLSLGVNLGIVAVLLVERTRGPAPPAAEAPPPAAEPPPLAAEPPPSAAEPPASTDERPAADNPAEGFPGPPAGAEEPPPGGRPGPERPFLRAAAEALERGELPEGIAWRLGNLADRLGLTGEDRDRFVEIQRRFFVESHERRMRIGRLQDRFRHALGDPQPSRGAIDELIRQLGEERAGFDRDLARTVLDTRALLAPGQERQYLEFLNRIGPRPGPEPPSGRPGPPGPARRPRPFRRPR